MVGHALILTFVTQVHHARLSHELGVLALVKKSFCWNREQLVASSRGEVQGGCVGGEGNTINAKAEGIHKHTNIRLILIHEISPNGGDESLSRRHGWNINQVAPGSLGPQVNHNNCISTFWTGVAYVGDPLAGRRKGGRKIEPNIIQILSKLVLKRSRSALADVPSLPEQHPARRR